MDSIAELVQASDIVMTCVTNTDEIESLLGYVSEPELIHRDNLVVLNI